MIATVTPIRSRGRNREESAGDEVILGVAVSVCLGDRVRFDCAYAIGEESGRVLADERKVLAHINVFESEHVSIVSHVTS